MSKSSAEVQESRTPVTDSLLHTNIMRVVLGGVCGIVAGVLMLGITTLFAPAGAGKLWWIQLMGSAIFQGHAMSYAMPSNVMVAGFAIHFGLSAVNGLVLGKMTTSHAACRMAIYGLVLGALDWLASNMFAPDFLNVQTLDLIGQWERGAIFVPFTIVTGILLAVSSKVLDA